MKEAPYNSVIAGIRDIASNSMPAGSQVLLYGSRARGDNRKDSDWDILLLVNKPTVEQEDYKTIVYPITSYGWDINEMIIPIIKTKKCRGCKRCTKECGSDAITVMDGKASINTDICKGCGRCIGACNFDAIFNILVATLCIYIASAVCGFIQGWLMTGISQRVCYQLRAAIAKKIDSAMLLKFSATFTDASPTAKRRT